MSANNHILSSHAYNLVSQAMKTVVGNYLDIDVPDVARAFKEFMDRCGSNATQISADGATASIQIRSMQ